MRETYQKTNSIFVDRGKPEKKIVYTISWRKHWRRDGVRIGGGGREYVLRKIETKKQRSKGRLREE